MREKSATSSARSASPAPLSAASEGCSSLLVRPRASASSTSAGGVPAASMTLPETQATLQEIGREVRTLVADQYRVLSESVLPALATAGVRLVRRTAFTPAQRAWVADYFHREVRPLLTPIGLDPAHPFPQVAGKSLNFIVDLGGRDAFGRETAIAIVKAPRVLPRVIRMDTSGKDGVIKHVMSGINPQGCQVASFKHPSATELEHDFLWRTAQALPERGNIGIFNRSHYEEVVVVRVHPGLLRAEGLPDASQRNGDVWKARYRSIVGWEDHLARNGTRILKFFLHVSKDEQRERLLERLDDPEKRWKFRAADVDERKCWDDYMQFHVDILGSGYQGELEIRQMYDGANCSDDHPK